MHAFKNQTENVMTCKIKTPSRKQSNYATTLLYEGQLVGGNVEGIDVGGEAGIGLLGAVRAERSVSRCYLIFPLRFFL